MAPYLKVGNINNGIIMEEEEETRLTVVSDHESVLRRFGDKLPPADPTKVPVWRMKEAQIGWLLGTGSFASVHAATNKSHSEQDITVNDDNQEDSTSRAEDSQYEYCEYTTNKKFALKRLRKDIVQDYTLCKAAVVDLLFEYEVLSRLPQHKNIIRLVARSENFLAEPEKGFLVVEQVQDTLKRRLQDWARILENTKPSSSSSSPLLLSFLTSRRPKELREVQQKRIQAAASGIAEGLKFLHSQKIVFRDLKPDNVAFAVDGTVKLLDFGLARPFHQTAEDRQRKLTGNAGTLRYMAPEVATSRHYGFAADSYSFALVLWEICTLQQPFENYKEVNSWFDNAIRRKRRPPLRPKMIPSPVVRELLQLAWDPNPEVRPGFTLIKEQLKKETEAS